jgi:hypothetical protein
VALATTAYVVGQAGSATPIVDGTATVGTSLRYARQDHVHPTDTSRAALASPTFTGTPLSTTAAVDTNTTQIATTAYVVGQGYAKLASPSLTGTPLAPTATAGTNTTQIATTAFVTAAVPAFATAAETVALASTSKTVTPDSLMRLLATRNSTLIPVNSLFAASQSGTGASASVYAEASILAGNTASISGYAAIAYTTKSKFSATDADYIPWNQKLSCTVALTTNGNVSGVIYRFAYGKSAANGALATKGIGFQYTSTGFVQIIAHNGTSLTTTNSTLAVSSLTTSNKVNFFEVLSYGSGTVELFMNGVSYGTGTGGPTSLSAAGQNKLTMEVASDGTQTSAGNATVTNFNIVPTL